MEEMKMEKLAIFTMETSKMAWDMVEDNWFQTTQH